MLNYGNMKERQSLITREFVTEIIGVSTFSPTSSYVKGDFVFYDYSAAPHIDRLWRCTADTFTGAFDNTKWEEIRLIDLFPYYLDLKESDLADPTKVPLITAVRKGTALVYNDAGDTLIDIFDLVPTYTVDDVPYYLTAANRLVEAGVKYHERPMLCPENPADMKAHYNLLKELPMFFYDDQVYYVEVFSDHLMAHHTQSATDYYISTTTVTELPVYSQPFITAATEFYNDLVSDEILYNTPEQREFASKVMLAPPPALLALNANDIPVDFYWCTADNTYSNGDKILTVSADGIRISFNTVKPVLINSTYANHAEPTIHTAAEPMYYVDGILTFVENPIPVYDRIEANVPYLHFESDTAFKVVSPNASTLYSTDGIVWKTTAPTTTYSAINIKLDVPVTESFGTFVFTSGDNIKVSGNLDAIVNIAGGGKADAMFKGCPIISFSSVLPNPVATGCYANMFEGTKLTNVPTLPNTLTQECFKGMFKDTLITDIPQFTETELPDSCFAEMFKGCPIKFADDGTKPFVVNYYNTPTGAFTDFATDVPTTISPNTIYYYKEV